MEKTLDVMSREGPDDFPPRREGKGELKNGGRQGERTQGEWFDP